ncbi:MAG: ribonuclease J [Actinobacteria bacterium]|jgi:ribonuclease J|nr:ribonuclease J [Actinomycetota bacterium]NCW34481.1 ribonuclease J [Actinomycetota bacterium]NCZ73150.1 ribonuclease J [Actinomycetota bacterium]NDA41309.1 ribonuclease J [Actinomycetota bacterium]NDB30943.1 ribonuclease J [Actinomycetota bacterium]
MNHPHPELGLPPRLEKGTLRIVALGGLGEVGRNMAVFEFDGQLLIVDCGVLFPEDTQPGVDLILPDFSYIRDRLDDVRAIFLTHGHEDHISALGYLLRERADIPVIGSALTLAFAKGKLRDHRITPITIEVKEGQRRKVDPFELEFVAVNHSIPDALAVVIRTPAGVVLHTGDFKMDQLPLDGRRTDLARFATLGSEGVDLFMVDSTNADIPGFTTSEREIMPVLDRVIAASKRRIIVASFASHVHRVQQVIDIAFQHNRKVAFIGRSMVRNMSLASEMGYLHIPPNTLVDEDEIDEVGDGIVLVCTGSQGEPLAALSRMANGDHRIRVGDGDTVILASSLIPGNENAVYRVINELTRFGARVVHKGNALVHVSGHAAAGELLYCYNVVKPKNVMPVHGEWRHLRANAELAVSTGVKRDRAIVAENGVVVDLRDGRASIVGAVPCGYVYVDGQSIGDITEASLKDRRILGEEGFISVIVVIDSQTGKIVAGPDIHARGFAEDLGLFDEVKGRIESALAGAVASGINGTHQLSQVVRKTVGSWVGGEHRRRPMIVPVVIEV